MKRDISIRFYGVEKANRNDPSLADVLREISKKKLKERKFDCDGVYLRLEHLEERNSKLFGEISRIQSDDYPSEITEEGRKALSTDNDLGHGIVFCLDPNKSILALRSDKIATSIHRIESYFSAAHPGASIHLRPKMKKDAWKEFQKRSLKKFTVKLAGFTDLTDLEGDDMAAFQGLKKFADGYRSHTITVTISMGHRKGFLDGSIKRVAKALFEREDENFEVRGMKATPASDPGERANEINLLDQILADRESVDIPRNDPDKAYELICAALERSLVRNRANL